MDKQKIPIFLQEEIGNYLVEERKDQRFDEEKYLQICNPPNIRINRARIIDWLLDVCRAFELRWESYWCAIELLDFMIFVVDFVRVSNIHIVAVTCLFIGSKIHETTPPSIDKII
jgi:hypothetical protein